ncbi:MAG: LUD domain-containing protein, partial [Candidatus Dormibacteraceae bacterium]
VETDLGERMVQLTGSHPSHLIAPAIHLTKEDAARVFGVEPEVAAIQAEARRSLREKFIGASVGITGANAAIAETGTLMLVTNEGNADLTTTLPPVHVAVFGTDKLVATLDDAVSMLRMLGRSGTGQRMTSYVNWITGPSRSADIEQSLEIGVHGPREVHCVVIDNGRSAMAADPVFKEALDCIRCGACSNVCPPFMAVGGHQFGHVYTGPIGLVLTPFHHGPEAVELPQSLCVQCNACQEVCPVGIPLPRQILEHRRRSRRPLIKEAALELWGHRGVAGPALRAAAPLTALAPGAPARLARWPFRSRVRRGGSGDPVTIFASCLVDRVSPGTGQALETIIRAAGFSVEFPKRQWCCGLIAANAGRFEEGASMAGQLAEALAGSPGPIVTPSASCFGAMAEEATEWGAAGDALWNVRSRMRDSTRFLLQLLEANPDLVRAPSGERIAYHDSCQTLRRLGLQAEPRRVLELAGFEVVPIPDLAACCGFGGTFSAEWPQVAARIAGWKLEAIARTGCAVVASDNPGCLMHIAGAARRRGADLRVAHVLELVAERLA